MRYKWLKAEWAGMSSRTLARRLKLHEFSDETADGFVVDRVRDDFVDARYIERLEYDEVTVDPFGRENALHRVEYRQAEFRAMSSQPGLELRDSLRSRSFLSRLSQATDFRVAVSAISVNVLHWAGIVQRNRPGGFYIGSVQVAGLNLSDGVTANFIAKGEGDVLAPTEAFLQGRKHVVDKVLLISSRGSSVKVLLTRGGSAKLEGDVDEELVGVIRRALSDSAPASPS